MYRTVTCLASALVFAVLAAHALAESRRVTEYDYDAAGNVTRIDSTTSAGTPRIDALSPGEVRAGATHAVTASGTDLKNATVTTTGPGTRVSVLDSTNETMQLELEIAGTTRPGSHELQFRTALGAATAAVTVHAPLPEIVLTPTPVSVPLAGPARTLRLGLSHPDILDHTITLGTGDTGTATVSPPRNTLPAGATTAAQEITVSGHARGSTVLELASATLADLRTTIFVTPPWSPPAGENQFQSRPIGVLKQPPYEPPGLATRGPFVAPVLGVHRPGGRGQGTGRTRGPLPAASVGVTRGTSLTSVSPEGLVTGSDGIRLTLGGHGLHAVDRVSFEPDAGITVGSPVPAGDGRSVSVPVSVDPQAGIGPRRVVVTAGGTRVWPASPKADRVEVLGGLPRLRSVEPIVVSRGDVAALTIRGRNLHHARRITLAPYDGVVVGRPLTVNAEGTLLRTRIKVAADAPPGPRVVTVTTAAGISDATPAAANTLRVVAFPGKRRTPLTAPLLGVKKGERQGGGEVVDLVRSGLLGVAVGPVLERLRPASGVAGTDVDLVLHGHGLAGVTEIAIDPADGIVVGIPDPAPDGRSVTVPLGILPDAPKTTRRLIVRDGSREIRPAGPDANRFRVTGPRPELLGMDRLHLVTGGPPVRLIVYGRNLDTARAVRVEPRNAVAVSRPRVPDDGRSLSVDIAALPSAATGPRVVVVETLAGDTGTTPTVANTLTLVDGELSAFTPFLAPLVGVEKQRADEGDGDRERTFPAPLVGVEKRFTPPATERDISVHGAALGVAVGRFASRVSPAAIPAGAAATLIVNGRGLHGVTGVGFEPGDGVIHDDAFAINPEGTELRLPVEVDPLATPGTRRLVLDTPDGPLPFSESAGDRLLIAGEEPVIRSIAPIQEVPTATFTLLIRGFNFADATGIDIEPADGIMLGSYTVNDTGTEIHVQVSISVNAGLGPRVVRVTTPAGTAPAAATPANTFRVVDDEEQP